MLKPISGDSLEDETKNEIAKKKGKLEQQNLIESEDDSQKQIKNKKYNTIAQGSNISLETKKGGKSKATNESKEYFSTTKSAISQNQQNYMIEKKGNQKIHDESR